MPSLSAAESTFVLIGIVLVLGLLLVWALFELETRPHRVRAVPPFCTAPASASIHAIAGARLG